MCRIFAPKLAKIWHILIPTNIVKVARTSIIMNTITMSTKSTL